MWWLTPNSYLLIITQLDRIALVYSRQFEMKGSAQLNNRLSVAQLQVIIILCIIATRTHMYYCIMLY